MADFYLLGKVSKEERPFFDYEYYFMINRIDEGDERDYVVFIKGSNMLENAISMWDLIVPERRKLYYNLLKKIEQDSNELEWGPYLITLDQVRMFLDIIDDLDVKLEEFLGSDGRVKEEYVDFVSRSDPSQIYDDGSFDYNGLKDEISNIRMMKHFLNQAIELNYPLATSG